MEKISLYGLSENEIYVLLEPYGFSSANAHELAVNIYKRRYRSFDDFIKIPERLRTVLKSDFCTGYSEFVDSFTSDDNTVKYLFRTGDGRQFEAVYIPEGKRHTVCVSTQTGCRMGCMFCVSGSFGFHGNLEVSEILNQVLGIPPSELITHVVFMGMGEPLDNFENVVRAVKALTAQWGMALSPVHVTVSTVGIKDAVSSFLLQSDCNLTLSLHSPFPDERLQFIPAEKRNPFNDVLAEMKSARLRKGRRLSVAYIMIEGLNDSEEHLNELIVLLKDTGIRVNLLPYHSSGNNNLRPSSAEKLHYFKHSLVMAGISASVRKSRGEDIAAACGLLAARLSGRRC